ncbi:MAG: hypothetical protein U0K91_06890 [Acutalibacteraceae bacterium]|nr:hypothetical protein [Acutalibacteraceae bacterium]
MSEQVKNEKKEKLPKPFEKFIWLLISCVIAVGGFFLRTGDFEAPLWLSIICALALLATIIIAAQKVSAERAAVADDKDKKLKYMMKTAVYYFYILVAVVFVFMSIWIVGILTI